MKNTLLQRLTDQVTTTRTAICDVYQQDDDSGDRAWFGNVEALQNDASTLCLQCEEAIATIQDYQELVSSIEEIINNEPKKSAALLVIRGLIEVKLHK